MNDECHLEAIPEEAVAVRMNDQGKREVLIKWKGLPKI